MLLKKFQFSKTSSSFDTKQTIQWRTNMRYNYLLTEIRFAFTFSRNKSQICFKMRFIIWSKTRRIKVQKIHLGNGCSMTAIKMEKYWSGFWSNERIDYGTRSGDVDQSVIFIWINTLGLLDAVNTMLQKQSGTWPYWLQRFKRHRSECGKRKWLSVAMNAYRIKKYIGSTQLFFLLMLLFFTAGIGENSSYIRKLVCTDMEYFELNWMHPKWKRSSN
jgi:acetate kinase